MNTSHHTSHHTRTVLLRVLAATAVTLLLGLSAGCGDGKDGDDSALPDAAGASSASPSGDGADSAADLDPEDAMLKFAQCMREHGVDMPDPDFTSGGARMQFRAGAGGVDPEGPTFQKAQEACQEILEEAFVDGPGFRVGGGRSDVPSTNSDGGS